MAFDFISVKEAAEKVGVTERWIQQLCKDGKIEGAMRLGGTGPWLVPANFKKYTQIKDAVKKNKTINLNGRKIHLLQSASGYVSPYSLFMLEKFPFNFSEDTRLCDYGAGTGILGIVAALYGVTKIASIENNDECFEIMKKNYKNNKIPDQELVYFKNAHACMNQFDAIVCNPASLPDSINVNSFCNGGVYGIDMILEVLNFSSKQLVVGGKLFIIITSVLPLSLIKREMAKLNLKNKIISTKIIPFREHYKGLAEWVDEHQSTFPEMYYIKKGTDLFEELLLFEIEKE